MLMAAGLGTRLRPFTDLEPKALLPLMGVPMAQFAIDAAVQAGVKRIVANVHHHPTRTQSGLAALIRGSAELVVSDESNELLGSAGGLRKASHHFNGEPFFLLNADVLCDVDLSALARAHQRARTLHGARLTLAVFPKPPLALGRTQREAYREILFDPCDFRVVGLGEKRMGRPFFVGAAVVEPEALVEIPAEGPAEFVPTLLMPAIRDKKAAVFLSDGQWHDIGAPGLWLESHLAMIRALETGRLSPAWRSRFESGNKRIGPQIWASKDVSSRWVRSSAWAGPCYWNPMQDSTATAPAIMGPEAVLYGNSLGLGPVLSSGIGYRGLWSAVSPNSHPE